MEEAKVYKPQKPSISLKNMAYREENYKGRLLAFYLAMKRYIAIKKILRTIGNNDSALDLGCGPGDYSQAISCQTLVSVDFDKESLVRAKGLRIRGDAEHLPLRNGTFSLALFSETLEHLHHPQDALSEVSRCLKPNGTLLISTPSRHSIFERQYFTYFKELAVYLTKRFIRHTKYETPHIKLWLPNELKEDLKQKSLRVVTELYRGFSLPFTGELFSLLFKSKRIQAFYEKIDTAMNKSKAMQSLNWAIIFVCKKAER